jgi:hypothetical protein
VHEWFHQMQINNSFLFRFRVFFNRKSVEAEANAAAAEALQKCRVPHSFAFFANEWVTEPSPIPKPVERAMFDLQGPFLKVYPHRTRFSVEIRPKADPPPLLRLLHQATLQGFRCM